MLILIATASSYVLNSFTSVSFSSDEFFDLNLVLILSTNDDGNLENMDILSLFLCENMLAVWPVVAYIQRTIDTTLRIS